MTAPALKIPRAESVSAAWFTELFRRHGYAADVTAVRAQQVGTGQIGKCVRYTLEYSQPSRGPNAPPRSLIVKYPSDDPTSRATGVRLRNYLKEVRFYQYLQSSLSIRTPVCYFAEIVDEGPEFAVVMEDLAPARQGDQLQGCDALIARAAVMELVGLHAPSWCDTSLRNHDWLTNADVSAAEVQAESLREMYQQQLPGFIDRYGHALAADEQQIITRVGGAETAPLFDGVPEVFSLVHVDYRLDNLLIGASTDNIEIIVVDWQTITLGAPLSDVAYFLGAGMLPEERARVERDIVRAYHQGLIAAGVADFSWDDCWLAYRRGVFAGFGVTVVASMLVQQTERGDRMFIAMAQRHARHALDLGAAEFLI